MNSARGQTKVGQDQERKDASMTSSSKVEICVSARGTAREKGYSVLKFRITRGNNSDDSSVVDGEVSGVPLRATTGSFVSFTRPTTSSGTTLVPISMYVEAKICWRWGGCDDGFPCSCTPNVDLASSPGSQEGPTSSPRQSAAGNRRRGALNVPQCVPHDSLLLLCVCSGRGSGEEVQKASLGSRSILRSCLNIS